MKRFRHVRLAGALLLLGACAAEVPEEDLPLPPPPPPRLQSARPAATPPARQGAEAEVPADDAAEPPAASEPAVGEVAAQPPQAWRVARDGTLGCAEPAPLRLARQGDEVMPRLLAEARAAGGCRTTFRVNEWVLEASEADLVRLRLLNGQALTLWFLRSDVVAP